MDSISSRPIRFRFNVEKLVHALAYFASQSATALDKLKAVKLLYFLDKRHLLRYGRPVIGDTYFCLDHGPIPSASLNLLNELAEPDDCSEPHPLRNLLAEYLEVDTTGRYPEFRSRRLPDLEVFSDSEVTALEETQAEYGDRTGWQLRNLTHAEPTWRIPDRGRSPGSRADIPYELFFAGQSADVQRLWSLVTIEQEDRDFAENVF